MKLGVFNPIFQELSLEGTLDKIADAGLQAIELRTGPNSVTEIRAGRYPAQNQCDPVVLLEDEGKLRAFQQQFVRRNLIISGLSCHGNPLHPLKEYAKVFHDVWRQNVLLAERLGVQTVIVFSGCPGGSSQDTQPNWSVTGWPPEFRELLNWQWEEVCLPYWREEAAFARQHGVNIAVEMHPGFLVYNVPTMLRLREACGENLGCNFDPSHLFWQQADPVAAIKALRGAIYHVHAKDTGFDEQNLAVNGVLDSTLSDTARRSWMFRTVGYGHDLLTWKKIVSALRVAGYDHVISIEHEDSLASVDEGFLRAVAALKQCLLTEPPASPWWL